HCLGQQPETDPAASYDLLADLLTAVPADKPKLWSEAIVSRLAELRPEVYGEWTTEQLATALKPYGIRTGQVWGITEDGKGANRRGIKRDDLLKVIAERDGNADAA